MAACAPRQTLLAAQSELLGCEDLIAALPRGDAVTEAFGERASAVVAGLRRAADQMEPCVAELGGALESVVSLDRLMEAFASSAASSFPHLVEDAPDAVAASSALLVADLLTQNDALHFVVENQRRLIGSLLLGRSASPEAALPLMEQLGEYEANYRRSVEALTRQANARVASQGEDSVAVSSAARLEGLDGEIAFLRDEVDRWRSRAQASSSSTSSSGPAATSSSHEARRGGIVRPSLLKDFQSVSRTMSGLKRDLQRVTEEYMRKSREVDEAERGAASERFEALKSEAEGALTALESSLRGSAPALPQAEGTGGPLSTLRSTLSSLTDHHRRVQRRAESERKRIIQRSEEEILRLADELRLQQQRADAEKLELIQKAESSVQSCIESCEEKLNFFNMYWEDQYSQMIEEVEAHEPERRAEAKAKVLVDSQAEVAQWRREASSSAPEQLALKLREARLEAESLRQARAQAPEVVQLKNELQEAVQARRDTQLQLARSERHLLLLQSRLRQLEGEEECPGAVSCAAGGEEEVGEMDVMKAAPLPPSMPAASRFLSGPKDESELGQILNDLRHHIHSFSGLLHESLAYEISTKAPLPPPSLFEYIGTLEADNRVQSLRIEELESQVSYLRGGGSLGGSGTPLDGDIERAREELHRLERAIAEHQSVPLRDAKDDPQDVMALCQLNDQLSNTLSILDAKLDELADGDTEPSGEGAASSSSSNAAGSSRFDFILSTSSSSSQSYIDLKNYILELELRAARLERQIGTDQALIADQKDQLDALYDHYRIGQDRGTPVEIESYRAKITALSREKDSLRTSLRKSLLPHSAPGAVPAKEEADRLAQENARLRAEADRLAQENASLLSETEQLTQESARLRSENSELHAARAQLESDASGLSEELRSKRGEARDLQRQLDVQNAAHSGSPAKELTHSAVEDASTPPKASSPEEEAEELARQLESLKMVNESLRQDLEQQRRGWEQRLEEHEEDSKRFLEEVSEARDHLLRENERLVQEKLSSSSADAKQFEAILDDRNRRLETLEREKADLKRRYVELEKRSLQRESDLQAEIAALHEQIAQYGIPRRVMIPRSLQRGKSVVPIYLRGASTGPNRAMSMRAPPAASGPVGARKELVTGARGKSTVLPMSGGNPQQRRPSGILPPRAVSITRGGGEGGSAAQTARSSLSPSPTRLAAPSTRRSINQQAPLPAARRMTGPATAAPTGGRMRPSASSVKITGRPEASRGEAPRVGGAPGGGAAGRAMRPKVKSQTGSTAGQGRYPGGSMNSSKARK